MLRGCVNYKLSQLGLPPIESDTSSDLEENYISIDSSATDSDEYSSDDDVQDVEDYTKYKIKYISDAIGTIKEKIAFIDDIDNKNLDNDEIKQKIMNYINEPNHITLMCSTPTPSTYIISELLISNKNNEQKENKKKINK